MATPSRVPTRVTYEQWLAMPEVNTPEEVIDGEVIHLPTPKNPHQRALQNANFVFLRQVDRSLIDVLPAPVSLVIRTQPLLVREPDLLLVERATAVERDGYFHSPPGLLLEVLSPSDRGRRWREKLLHYAEFGVPEVWALALRDRTVEVYRLSDGRLVSQGVYGEGTLRPARFPDVAVRLEELWIGIE